VTVDGRKSHCYRVRLPSEVEAYRIRGLEPAPERTVRGITYEAASDKPGPAAILCGSFGPPCFHCGGASEALCADQEVPVTLGSLHASAALEPAEVRSGRRGRW
jgi:hypothetical protein